MEVQFVKPKPHYMEWAFPTLVFEICRRDVAPFFTIGILYGRSIARMRVYWKTRHH